MEALSSQKCVPCEGGVPPLTHEKIEEYHSQIEGWTVEDDKKIHKDFKFKDFPEAIAFVNKAGDIAEDAGHHPDLNLHGWNNVTVTLYTHAIGGLSVNDFIIAARIDGIKL